MTLSTALAIPPVLREIAFTDARDRARTLLSELGYHRLDLSNLDDLGESPSTALPGVLAEATRRLNPLLDARGVSFVVRQVLEGRYDGICDVDEAAHEALVHGVSLTKEAGAATAGAAVLIDFDNLSRNHFAHARIRVGSSSDFDLVVVFVNGVPLVAIGQLPGAESIGEVVERLVRWQRSSDDAPTGGLGPRRFVQFLVARHQGDACWGTPSSPAHRWTRWSDGAPDPSESANQWSASPFERLVRGLLERETLLDLVRSYTVFDRAAGRLRKRVAHGAQFVAVSRALSRVRDARQPAARSSTVTLAHGSGRTLAMAFLAAKLATQCSGATALVLVVSDRERLTSDVSSVFLHRRLQQPVHAKSAVHLNGLLSNRSALTITTSFTKLQGAMRRRAPLVPSAPVFVLLDDPPRGPDTAVAGNIRRYMPDACVLSFSGTPVRRKDVRILDEVGPYVFRYGTEQSIDDGLTVPIVYDQRLVPRRAKDARRRRDPSHLFDLEDESFERIRIISEDLSRHFVQHVMPLGFKAQLFAENRRAAMTYKALLDDCGAVESAVVTSTRCETVEATTEWRRARMSRRAVFERFADPADPLGILIVCDVADFDAPSQHVLYLDAHLRDYTLLRAMARVNRTAAGKSHGLVVDYRGVLPQLERALRTILGTDLRQTRSVAVRKLGTLDHTDKRRRQAPVRSEFSQQEISP